MKKKVIIITIIFLIIFDALFIYISKTNVPFWYKNNIETYGEIESKYVKNGEYKVKKKIIKVDSLAENYYIFYPENMAQNNSKYPMVIFVNGTNNKTSGKQALLTHLASWGFIVVGNDEENSWSGIETNKMLDYMLSLNESDEFFKDKIDINNIGIIGHSQGGAGAINAVNDKNFNKYYKTIVLLSPVGSSYANKAGWNYNPSLLNIPVAIFAGTSGEFENEVVIPYDELIEIYTSIEFPKLMARKTGCNHTETLYAEDGYTTAWFMYYLKNDNYVTNEFIKNKELNNNILYQDVYID